MNKRTFSVCAGVIALATLFTVSCHAQADLPPPPPPIGPYPNAPQPPMPPILPPQAEMPSAVPPLPETAVGPVLIAVDATAKRHDISPLIYSLSSATPAQLQALNVLLFPQSRGAGLADFRTIQPKSLRQVFSEDTSPDTQAQRSRSTRLLWDPRYGSPQGAGAKLAGADAALIPSLKSRLKSYPAGTKAGLLNYSWGAEKSIGGATAQADVLGIFGRESLDLATRTAPDAATPTFKAIQMYRNYDGKNSMFGSVSVSDTVPNPDTLSSFASVRRSDGALTIMVINKSQAGPASVLLTLSHFKDISTAQVWQLTESNKITPQPSAAITTGHILATVPASSVTLFVVKGR